MTTRTRQADLFAPLERWWIMPVDGGRHYTLWRGWRVMAIGPHSVLALNEGYRYAQRNL